MTNMLPRTLVSKVSFLMVFFLFSLSLLNGVHLNEAFNLPGGSVGLFTLLCLALLPFYKVNYKFFPAASLVLIFFLIYFYVGIKHSLSVEASTISFILIFLFWVFTYLSLFFNTSDFSQRPLFNSELLLKVGLVINVFFSFIYLFSLYSGVDYRIFPEPSLFDRELRFSGTFGEPSYLGFFSLFCAFFFLMCRNYRWFFLSLLILSLTRSKFSIFLFFLGCFIFIFSVFFSKRFFYFLSSFIVFAPFFVLAFFYYFQHEFWTLIYEYVSFQQSKTFVTRLGFLLVSFMHLLDYPLGTGFEGYKLTLKPYLYDFVSIVSYLDVSEMKAYLYDDSVFNDFSPKDVLSFFILSFGFLGLLLFNFLFISLLYFSRGDNHLSVLVLVFFLSSIFGVQLNSIFFVVFLIMLNQFKVKRLF
ncbi:hypothetical protein ACE02P_07095 [Shewanella bicestrii]